MKKRLQAQLTVTPPRKGAQASWAALKRCLIRTTRMHAGLRSHQSTTRLGFPVPGVQPTVPTLA